MRATAMEVSSNVAFRAGADGDHVRLSANAGRAMVVVDGRRDLRRDRGTVASVVVAVERRLRDGRAADDPEAVDLALQVGHVVNARVEHADDDPRIALREIERALDVHCLEDPLIWNPRLRVDRVEKRIVGHARRPTRRPAPGDVANPWIARGVREQ
jgi:hypothetical protein